MNKGNVSDKFVGWRPSKRLGKKARDSYTRASSGV